MTATTPKTSRLTALLGHVAQSFFELTHNGFAFVGFFVISAIFILSAKPEIRQGIESHLMEWLASRQGTSTSPSTTTPPQAQPDVKERTAATNPQSLPKHQSDIAYWLSKKYNVAPEPVSALVAEAYSLGQHPHVDPALILAVVAIESAFNPFAQSTGGAQGLMQVMTKIHSEKYQIFGGKLAAFDPISNLRVGVKILQDCVVRAGSTEGGLRLYVGAGTSGDDGGYTAKVLAERNRIIQAVSGQKTAIAQTAPRAAAPISPSAPKESADNLLDEITS